jgi:PilZ domain
MDEQRKATRFNVHVPLQICTSQRQPPEFFTGQLRDISRTGIRFHSEVPFEIGTTLALAFCLPSEGHRTACVLARATVTTIRACELPGAATKVYGIAVTIDRIDFAQPSVSSVA